MTDIIGKMRGDLREILRESVVDYPSKAREKWIFDWPSQIILVVNQIYWCQEVEEAFMKLNKGQSNAMKVCNPSVYPAVFVMLALCVSHTPNVTSFIEQGSACTSKLHVHIYRTLAGTRHVPYASQSDWHCCRSTTSFR